MEGAILNAAKIVEQQVDAEIEKLEQLQEDDIEKLREKRLKQMKQLAAQQQEWRGKGHGEYRELSEEKMFFEECKQSDKVVCHFYRESTWRCKIVDKHLAILAPKHLETKFIKLSVERCPFLCDRLKIRIIPTIALVIDGKTKDYIKGFDDLGGHDEFPTEILEWRLGCAGVINYSGNLLEPPTIGGDKKSKGLLHSGNKIIRSQEKTALNDDSDDD